MTHHTCQVCSQTFDHQIAMRCGHNVCSHCYVSLKANRPNPKSNKCGCPFCGRNMLRKLRKLKC